MDTSMYSLHPYSTARSLKFAPHFVIPQRGFFVFAFLERQQLHASEYSRLLQAVAAIRRPPDCRAIRRSTIRPGGLRRVAAPLPAERLENC